MNKRVFDESFKQMAVELSHARRGIRKFPTAKQFTSWLKLCPNTKVSGGRVLSSHIPKG